MADARYEATRRAWTRIWEHTDLARELGTREYARSKHIRALFVPHLPRTAPVLEAGCGLGVEVLGLAADGYTIVGVDYVTTTVQRLKAYRTDLRLAAGDIHALPFLANAMGAVLSFGVLEHFDFGPEPGLREAYRVLKPGGVLVLTVPAPNIVWKLVRLMRKRKGQPPSDADSYFETAYTADELQRFVRAAGFEVIEYHPVGHSFTLWGCGRPFRGRGYYETSALAERLGAWLARIAPWATSFATLLIARKGVPA